MTTYTKQVYSGMPFQYRITKPRYYDTVVTKTISADTVDEVTLEPYGGLSAVITPSDVTAQKIEINPGILPDYSSFGGKVGVVAAPGYNFYWLENADGPAEILKGVLNSFYRPQPGTYNIFIKNGEVLLSQNDTLDGYMWAGDIVLSDNYHSPLVAHFDFTGNVTFTGYVATFSSGGYITADSVGAGVGTDPIDFITKVTPASVSSYRCVVRDKEANTTLGTYGSSWCLYIDGTRYTGGTVVAGTTYWFRVVEDAADTKLYYLEGNKYSMGLLPDLSEWTLAATAAGKKWMIPGDTILLSSENSSYGWQGTIDLNSTILKRGMSQITQFSIWKPLDRDYGIVPM